MSTENLPSNIRVTRFYTAARRIPTLIGKLPNGGYIPGGPYTVTQGVLIIGTAGLGFFTMPTWSGGQASLTSFVKLGLLVVSVAVLSRRIRWRGRQAVPAMRGAWNSYTASKQLRQGAKAVTAQGPRPVRGRVLVVEDPEELDFGTRQKNPGNIKRGQPQSMSPNTHQAKDRVRKLVTSHPQVMGRRTPPMETTPGRLNSALTQPRAVSRLRVGRSDLRTSIGER